MNFSNLKSAESKISNGQNYTGNYYEIGMGTAVVGKKAFELLLKSAKSETSNDQNISDYCYEDEMGTAEIDKQALNGF